MTCDAAGALLIPWQFLLRHGGDLEVLARIAVPWSQDPVYPVAIALVAATLVLAAAYRLWPRAEFLYVGVTHLGIAPLFAITDPSGFVATDSWPLWLALFVAAAGFAANLRSCRLPHAFLVAMTAVVGAVSAVAFANTLILVLPLWGVEGGAAITISWALYGCGLLAVGLRLASAPVRLYGSAWIALAVLKVLFHDLVSVPLYARFGMLLVVGTAILAASYWVYIRPRRMEA